LTSAQVSPAARLTHQPCAARGRAGARGFHVRGATGGLGAPGVTTDSGMWRRELGGDCGEKPWLSKKISAIGCVSHEIHGFWSHQIWMLVINMINILQ